MLKRTVAAGPLNLIANNPAVRPWLLGEGYIDLTEILANPANVALACNDGAFVFIANGLADYEVHTFFLPGTVDALAAAQEAAEWMFCNTDAMRIVTKCPDANMRARSLADAVGFRPLFHVADWACMALDIDAWAMGLCDDPVTAATLAATFMQDAGAAVKASAWLARWSALAGFAPVALAEAA